MCDIYMQILCCKFYQIGLHSHSVQVTVFFLMCSRVEIVAVSSPIIDNCHPKRIVHSFGHFLLSSYGLT